MYYDSGGGEAEVEAASEEFSLHADRLGEAASLACSMSGSEEGDTDNRRYFIGLRVQLLLPCHKVFC